ncbi:MAG: hypothetical protein ACYSWQ_04440 [Planctomycetota bacterium]|jgi:hypothetical protein
MKTVRRIFLPAIHYVNSPYGVVESVAFLRRKSNAVFNQSASPA